MEFLLAFAAGQISIVMVTSVFGKPEDYYKNRCKGLEDEISRIEKLYKGLLEETRQRGIKLDSEELLRKMR